MSNKTLDYTIEHMTLRTGMKTTAIVVKSMRARAVVGKCVLLHVCDLTYAGKSLIYSYIMGNWQSFVMTMIT